MGAEVVIAVDISAPLLERGRLRTPLDISNQAIGMTSRKALEALLPGADVLIVPELDGIGTLAFNQAETAIEAGRAAAEAARDELAPYVLQRAGVHPVDRTTPTAPTPVIASIRIEGANRVDERIIRSQIHQAEGRRLEMDRLTRDLSRVFGLGDFELVDFDLLPESEGTELVIRVKEKFWGPTYLHGNVQLTMDDDQNTDFRPQLNIIETRLNNLGLEWSTDIEIGEAQALESSLYQPLDFDGRFYLEGVYRFTRDLQQLFGESGRVEVEGESHTLALYSGINLGVFAEIRAGLIRGISDLRARSEGLSFDDETEIGGMSLGSTLDRLDSFTFPREGGLTAVTYFSSRPALGADDAYTLLVWEQVLTRSWGRHTLLSWFEGGTRLEDVLPGYAQFGIGGFSSLSGYERGELIGSRYAIYRPTYLYRTGSLSPVLGRAVYLGGWLEAGNIWTEDQDPALDDLRFAATLVLGVDTVLGPIYLGVGVA